MKCKTALTTVMLLLASLPLAARQYILEASPTDAPAIATQYGLTIVRQLPNHNLFFVTASDSITASQEISLVSSDSRVVDFELDGLAHQPETNISNSLQPCPSSVLNGVASPTAVDYFGTQVSGLYVNQPATGLIRLANAQSTFGATGAGMTVAIVDTGVDPNHATLSKWLVPGYDFVNNAAGIPNEFNDLDQSTAAILDQSTAAILDQSTAAILDQSTAAILDQSTAAILDPSTLPPDFGHGTMVAGIVHLVAPQAWLMPIKAFSADGTGNLSNVLQAIYYAVDTGHADVINMSFDIGQTNSTELTKAVNYANSNGVVLVSSAGNSGQFIQAWPAASDNVLGIASTTDSDTQSSFTNYGPVADMAAPGECVITTYPGSYTAEVWGTSFSTPFVSGTAALLKQFKSNLNESSASDALANAKRINQYLGYGRLDVYGAVSTYAGKQ